jgi:hypothetical protein
MPGIFSASLFAIVPAGRCSQLIQNARGFQNQAALNKITIAAIIALAFGEILAPTPAHAQSCTVDPTANYDQRQPAGTCSVRGLNQSQCSTVPRVRHFKPDHGSGFTECFFDPPPNNQGRSGTSHDWNAACDSAIKDLQKAISLQCRSLINECNSPFMEIRTYCPRANRSNVIQWAEREIQRVRQWAQDQERREQAQRERDQADEVNRRRQEEEEKKKYEDAAEKFMEDLHKILRDAAKKVEEEEEEKKKYDDAAEKACSGPDYVQTAFCRSDAPNMSQQKYCINAPQETGSDNYSFTLNLACSAEYYMAAIATYDDSGQCTRDVVILTPKNSNAGHVKSSTRLSAKQPHVMDAIIAVRPELQACYLKRHKGCPCASAVPQGASNPKSGDSPPMGQQTASPAAPFNFELCEKIGNNRVCYQLTENMTRCVEKHFLPDRTWSMEATLCPAHVYEAAKKAMR